MNTSNLDAIFRRSHRINQCWAGAHGYIRGCPVRLEARLADQLRRTAVRLQQDNPR